jgi:hypothetical protein
MSTLGIMVFVAPVFAAVAVVCTGYFAMWLDERDERRNTRQQAGE